METRSRRSCPIGPFPTAPPRGPARDPSGARRDGSGGRWGGAEDRPGRPSQGRRRASAHHGGRRSFEGGLRPFPRRSPSAAPAYSTSQSSRQGDADPARVRAIRPAGGLRPLDRGPFSMPGSHSGPQGLRDPEGSRGFQGMAPSRSERKPEQGTTTVAAPARRDHERFWRLRQKCGIVPSKISI